MKFELYCYYDRKTGLYSMPQAYQNAQVAIRAFNYNCSLCPDKIQAEDMELYLVATFDSSKGSIVVKKKPVFVKSYVMEVVVDEK